MKPPCLSWDLLDWEALDRLRDIFLSGKPGSAVYWTSHSDLENYEFTFAQRIAWKWDAVLCELKLRGWTPPPGPLLDWGCGSGIAGRRVVEVFGEQTFECLRLFDRSALAMEFAEERARDTFPSLRIEPVHEPPPLPTLSPAGGGGEGGRKPGEGDFRKPSFPERRGTEPGASFVGTLVISHVLNELNEAGGRALRHVLDRADAVLWVEPGTHADSRALIAFREALLETFHLIAPCTHQAACGLRTPENNRHWCHHFASPPAGIMADSNWVRFSQRAGIDLRSLPYSFLVLERKGRRDPVPGLLADGYSRVIGEPRFYKGFAKIFSCQADGVRDLTLQKRAAPQLFKAFKHGQTKSVPYWKLPMSEGPD